jgi:Cu/Ag efflux pump CusA
LNESVDLAAKLHARTLANLDQSAADLASINAQKLRCEADNAYVTRYDLSNPVTTGSGDALRSASYPANRAVDTASAGVAAGVAEDVQGNVTTQLSALTTQVMALANAVTNQQAVFTTALQALTDSNASIAASLAKLAGAK